MTAVVLTTLIATAMVLGAIVAVHLGFRAGDRRLDAPVATTLAWEANGDHLAPSATIDVRNPSPVAVMVAAEIRRVSGWTPRRALPVSVQVPWRPGRRPLPSLVLGAVDAASTASWRVQLAAATDSRASGLLRVAVSVYQGDRRLRVSTFLLSPRLGPVGSGDAGSLAAWLQWPGRIRVQGGGPYARMHDSAACAPVGLGEPEPVGRMGRAAPVLQGDIAHRSRRGGRRGGQGER